MLELLIEHLSVASVAPAASGCAYGSRRRSAAAEEEHEQEKDGWGESAALGSCRGGAGAEGGRLGRRGERHKFTSP